VEERNGTKRKKSLEEKWGERRLNRADKNAGDS
jgi:hypothetical protein